MKLEEDFKVSVIMDSDQAQISTLFLRNFGA